MLVTIERNVLTDGGYTKLFGLPFPFISNSYASSFRYDVYILEMILDLLFYFSVTFIVFKLLLQYGVKLKSNSISFLPGIVICLFWIITFILTTRASDFKIKNSTKYKTIDKKIIFGMKP